MNPDFTKFVLSLGVGGVLAAGMFWVYRKDAQLSLQRMELLANRVASLADRLLDTTAAINTQLGSISTLLAQLLQRVNEQK